MKKCFSVLLALCMVLSAAALPTGPMVVTASASEAAAASEIIVSPFSATWSTDYLSEMPRVVKDRGLKILLPHELHTTESRLITEFKQKTGCKVDVTVTTEAAYVTKLISMIAQNNAPDVCVLQSHDFPGIVTKALQPLNRDIFRLDDVYWYKPYMDAFSVNGQCFSVAMQGSWNCEDGNYVTYYQPGVLRACGVTTTPYELYQDGQWNWDAQYQIASAVKTAGKGYCGMMLQSADILMLSAGQDFVSYDGKQFTNALSTITQSSLLNKSWQEISKLNENGILEEWNVSYVQQGKVGLFTVKAYGMYDEGGWLCYLPGGDESIEAVPVAGPTGTTAYTPVSLKTWGVAKTASNPEGAAYFLRYFLDPDNYDMDATFVNSQFQKVYQTITDSSAPKQIRYGSGVLNYAQADNYEALCQSVSTTPQTGVVTLLKSYQGSTENEVAKVNGDLSNILPCSHLYDNACDPDCNLCGAGQTVYGHRYSATCDETCNSCGYTRIVTHTYKTTTTKATTSKNGSIVKKCNVCGKVASTKTVYYAKSFSLSTTSYTYNGKVKTPSVTVKDSKGNKLKKDTDYTVSYTTSGRKNIGTYKVKVTLKGNYSGSKTLSFTINPKIKLSTTKYTYNGKARKPSVTVTNSSGKKLSTKYYTVSYSSGRKKVGTYTVTVKFKNGHSGTYKQTFVINPKGTSVSKLTAAKKSLKVSIKKQSSQTTGYQIQYSTSKKFSSKYTKSTTVSYKTTSKTIKSLSAKKTYYVRVRTYKTVNGKKYYSGWSSVKSKKTK